MKPKLLLFCLSLFLTTHIFAQDQVAYKKLINEAWELYDTKDFLPSAKTYNQAFNSWSDNTLDIDRYNAACSWSLAGEVDSSFFQLFKIAQGG